MRHSSRARRGHRFLRAATIAAAFGIAFGIATPTAEAVLTHRWTFTADASDSVGGANGVLNGSAIVAGGQLELDGITATVDLDAPAIGINTYQAITLETWATPSSMMSGFSTLLGFGQVSTTNPNNAENYFILQTHRTDDVSRAAISLSNDPDPWTEEDFAEGPELNDNQQHHYVAVLTNSSIGLYVDGQFQSAAPVGAANGGNPINNMISGLSTEFARIGTSYPGDPLFIGLVNDVRLYNHVLSGLDVLRNFVAGADNIPMVATATLLNPGMSTWTDPMAWSTDPLFPNNGNGGFDYDVVIDNGGVADVPIMTSIIVDTVALDDGSIGVNGSLMARFGLTTTSASTITGNGTVIGNVTSSGQVTIGNGTIAGNLINSGRVSPGGLGAFATLGVDDGYQQLPDGVLEIEVGDLSPPPGLVHDQLNVLGTAELAGRLELPIVFPFTPLDPTQDPQIVFLTATEVDGQFDSLYSPNLADAMPEVAVEILYNPGMPGGLPGDVRARFVAPTPGGPLAATGQATEWSAPGTFTMPPNSTQVIELSNVGPAFQPQRVNVQTANAFAHRLIVIGASPLDTMTVAVSDGRSLSATAGVIVGQNAIVELGSELPVGTTTTGNLVSATVDINSGGRLAGIGTVVGNLNVGTDSGPEQATFDPGFSVGHVEVVGNYQQGANGLLTIDVDGTADGEFDTVNVTGNVSLGGSLTFDVSNLPSGAAGTFRFLTAGSADPAGDMLENFFQAVTTEGNDINRIYVALSFGDVTAGAGGASVGGNYEANGESCVVGDMNCSGGDLDMVDVDLFARALRTPNTYHLYTIVEYGKYIDANTAGNADNLNNGLDFDDIDEFATMVSGSGSGASFAAVVAAIERALHGVPEPSTSLLLVVGACLLGGARPVHRRRSER